MKNRNKPTLLTTFQWRQVIQRLKIWAATRNHLQKNQRQGLVWHVSLVLRWNLNVCVWSYCHVSSLFLMLFVDTRIFEHEWRNCLTQKTPKRSKDKISAVWNDCGHEYQPLAIVVAEDNQKRKSSKMSLSYEPSKFRKIPALIQSCKLGCVLYTILMNLQFCYIIDE